jgi:hypothetical protein
VTDKKTAKQFQLLSVTIGSDGYPIYAKGLVRVKSRLGTKSKPASRSEKKRKRQNRNGR